MTEVDDVDDVDVVDVESDVAGFDGAGFEALAAGVSISCSAGTARLLRGSRSMRRAGAPLESKPESRNTALLRGGAGDSDETFQNVVWRPSIRFWSICT